MFMDENYHYGVVGVREGLCANELGKVERSMFTHRNPNTGEVYGEDLTNRDEDVRKCKGKWVRPEEVVWI